MIEDNLMFATDKVGNTMTVAMTARRRQGVVRRAAAGPDGRGAGARRRLAVQLFPRASTRTTSRPSGWNNLVFPNVGMPHVLWSRQGVNRLVDDRVRGPRGGAGGGDRGQGARAARAGEGWQVRRRDARRRQRPARCRRSQYKAMVADLVNYLDYMAEPASNERINARHRRAALPRRAVRLRLRLKRDYWKDVH